MKSTNFYSLESNITYPVAGSFVLYLTDEYGLNLLKNFYSMSYFNDGKRKTFENFESVYNQKLNDCWRQWKQFLTAY